MADGVWGTGESCEKTGAYEGTCRRNQHHNEFIVTQGEVFPPCAHCNSLVDWRVKMRGGPMAH